MGGSGPSELPTEWWDSLAGGEPVLGGSPERPTIQSWTWADHQVDDCFSLEPLCFPGEVTAGEGETAQLPDLVVGKLEDLFLVPGLADVRTPSRHVFKQPFDAKTPPSPRGQQPPVRTISPRTPGQSDGSSSQTRANSDIVVDLQITADDRSNSVTCTITSSDDGNRRSQADSGKGSTGRMDADDVSKALVFEGNVIDSKAASSLREDNSSSPGLAMDVDLQCDGEQLPLEGEEESGLDASKRWLSPAKGGCLGFIPVTNVVLPEASSLSTGRPSQGTADGATSNADSAETQGGLSTSHQAAKPADSSPPERPQPEDPQIDDAEDSPAASVRESVQSDGTVLGLGIEGKRRTSKPGKLVDAASVSDMASAGWESPGGNRRRPGRPSKVNGLALEARAASVKRKRPTTCKPAAPAVSGHACTQCFTHVTPVWRAGPEGPKTLCNACGVRYMKVAKRK